METKILTFLALLLLATSCQVVKMPPNIPVAPKNFVKLKGTDSIYFYKYEVSNIEYERFLSDIKNKQPALFKRCQVDSIKWDKDGMSVFDTHPYIKKYMFFKDYPVVNISKFAAEQYCQWLTNKYKGSNLHFRLPHKEEFLRLAETVEIEYQSTNLEDYDKFHFNLVFGDDYGFDGQVWTAPTRAGRKYSYFDAKDFKQNSKGFYHIVGNVEELLSNGKSIGGSWYSNPNEVFDENDHNIPDPRVGFRVVMVKDDSE